MPFSTRASSKKYDVFISFRGEDTRTNFTSHLHTALCDKKIETYIDYQLRKGDEIWPTLSRAIEDSHISVVVFSKDYASSKWCLEELVKIVECRKHQGQVVIPVFYNTDPSHVRKQKESYESAFARHERDLGSNDESGRCRVRMWRAALTEVANVSGWDSRTYKDDSQFIKNIVNDVLHKLYLRYPNYLKGLVGIDKICAQIELLLKNVQVIGIWGMGGMGKTTIGKVVFAKLFPLYDSVCFMENVSEESKKHGPTYSREKLMFELLKEENPRSNFVGGTTFNMRRLKNKKAFIVLDDVDSFEQLEYLCGERGDLGPDSRLVITTRNKHLLIGRVDEIFEVKRWNSGESLKLFSLNAFMKSHPDEGYEHLSQRAVNYAGGVPLALKVLGSYLRSRSKVFWESTLSKLEKYPNETIQNLLKVSYDGLDSLDKKIFLDVAFFFKDENKDDVISILDACGFFAASGIDVLVDNALITISCSNRIEMHDLLQEMGWDIVRQECSTDPGQRSRLRDEEAYDILKNNKGTEFVEGITLDLSRIHEDLHLSAEAFKLMPNLRFLKVYTPSGKQSGTVYLPSVVDAFSDKLRYLEWNGYGSKSLSPTFCAKFLVEISMPNSHIEELWQGRQELENLERIDLRGCKQLSKLPDLSSASKLKWVYLSDCESLCDLHPSVLSLDTLVTLTLDRCINLKSLKSEKHLRSLEKLSVNGCLSLREFSVSSDLINRLDLSKTGTEILHSSIGRLCSLVWLNLEGLRLKNLPDELSCLKSLMELRISKCELVISEQKLHVLFDGLRSLKLLHLKDCCNMSEIPDNISMLSLLHELRLDKSSVVRLPESIKYLQELEILSLENCRKLQCLPELPPSIKEFYAVNCTSLVTVSTLKTFTLEMKGKYKYISFKNGLKLDEPSLQCILEGAHLTMMSALFHNVLVRRYGVYAHSYNYNSVRVCLPGSSVLRRFTYRTTESSCIDIELPLRPKLLGFFLCVVLSPSRAMKKHGAQLECECYLADGTMVGYYGSTWHDWYHKPITDLNSEHVFAWYDPLFCDSILRTYKRQVSFKFSVTTDAEELDRLTVIKECGVCLLHASEFHSFLRELEMEQEKKVHVGLKLGLALDMELRLPTEVETSLLNALEEQSELKGNVKLEFESRRKATLLAIKGKEIKKPNALVFALDPTRIWNNQTQDLSVTESKSVMEESSESAGKDKKNSGGRGREEDTVESTKAVTNERNGGMPTESDVGLHLPTVLIDEENSFIETSTENDSTQPDNIEEAKHSKENQNLQVRQSTFQSDILDLTVQDPSKEKENKPIFQHESDEDPLAELQSILYETLKSTPRATCSTSDVPIRDALHNLECILENSLESILSDF